MYQGQGTNEDFCAHGTCFCVHLIDEDFTFDYLISAQHLLWPNRKKNPKRPPDSAMVVRLNTSKGTSTVLSTPPNKWIYPDDPSIDVCAMRFNELVHGPTDELVNQSQYNDCRAAQCAERRFVSWR